MLGLDKELYELFITENRERLSDIEANLKILSQEPSNTEKMFKIKQALHTMKSTFATVSIQQVVTACHKAEDVLNILEKNGYFEPLSLKIFVSFVDKLTNLLIYISNIPIPYSDFSDRLNKIINDKKEFNFSSVIQDLDNIRVETINIEKHYTIIIKLDPQCQNVQEKFYYILKSLESIAKIISSTPKLNDLEKRIPFQDLYITIISTDDESSIRIKLLSIPEVLDVLIERTDTTATKTTDSPSTNMVPQSSLIQSIRVPLTDLDGMMDMLGEVVIAKNMLSQNLEPILDNHQIQLAGLNKALSDLRNIILKTRLVSIEFIYAQLPRIVRETNKITNKNCDLILSGKHVEIDRYSIDLVNEALIHLIRNAIDHGIELSEDRKKKNKPENGRININAVLDQNTIVITVEDDGMGINIPLLKQKAIKNGLIMNNFENTRENLHMLLFMSRTSTSEQITEVSGRGIGLNIVYTNIVERLQGSIDVETSNTKGTKFILRISNLMPIFNALAVQVNNRIYFIPVAEIRKIYHISTEKILNYKDKKYIVVNREIIPIISLKERFLIDKAFLFNDSTSGIGQEHPSNTKVTLVLCGAGTRKIGLIVDTILTIQQIVLKKGDSLLSNIKEYSGFTIINQGEISPVLNPIQFLGSI